MNGIELSIVYKMISFGILNDGETKYSTRIEFILI